MTNSTILLQNTFLQQFYRRTLSYYISKTVIENVLPRLPRNTTVDNPAIKSMVSVAKAIKQKVVNVATPLPRECTR